ncbi:MAG: DUF2723 domain-containing protein [Flavobacteriales bacterium]|nr:DUF2723 domain-containing protein [Flavobacteriales bacterium]
MNNFKKLNILFGWLSFAIAMVTYGLTIEPTTSFWDCGEFISTAYKLQVGHPPGAPLFAMMARIFTLFAGSDVSKVAIMVNLFSAFVSALTIAFLFWSITALVYKIYRDMAGEKNFQWDNHKVFTAIGSGLLGALAYTYTDTFWFSAVEGEVYALSSLFTAVVFWAMLKWEQVADEPHADRWIVLIAYLMGLSIGVHLLNLLTIPALGFIYYFRKYKPTTKGVIITLAISMAILLFIQYGIIQRAVGLAGVFDKLFVNTFGLGFGSGIIFYLILLTALFAFGIFYSIKNGKPVLNLALISSAVIIIGYSSYGMIITRSVANTPMDENNPENVYSFISYLNREQYGDRPLFYGPYYDAEIKESKPGDPIYIQAFLVKDKKNKTLGTFTVLREAQAFIENHPEKQNLKIVNQYVQNGHKPNMVYDPNRMTIFPRLHSSDPNHRSEYEFWANIKKGGKPDFVNNITFLFRYQFGWMYWRYFMWNFSGRENDNQGYGDANKGHWITGINAIDKWSTGMPQTNLPDELKENRGRNKYFMLPLVLGLIGLVFQLTRDKQAFTVVALFFLMTGLATVFYLNQPPIEPRERDYTYAGSFYAFAIWIGLAFMAIMHYMKDLHKNDLMVPAVAAGIGVLAYLVGSASGNEGMGLMVVVISLLYLAFVYIPHALYKAIKNQMAVGGLAFAAVMLSGPALLAKENWDDHTRAKRYSARDFAYNYLNTCAPNAILFTNGDNDTFPLWYLQEVEGVRTDVRIVNLSLLNTDWYISQMKRKAYDGLPVPFGMKETEYRQGTRDQVLMDRESKQYYTVQDHMKFLLATNVNNQVQVNRNDKLYYLRSNKFILPVDSAKAVQNGIVPPGMENRIQKSLSWEVNKPYILKAEVMILDLLANFNWERPIYFAITVGSRNYFGLEKFFLLDGMAYRLVPFETKSHDGQEAEVNTPVMYKKFMEEFKWGNINHPDVYLDETNMRMTMNFRNNFTRLASKLMLEGKKEEAIKVLDKAEEIMPDFKVPYNYFSLLMGDLYVTLGAYEQAERVLSRLKERSEQWINYYAQLKITSSSIQDDLRRQEYVAQQCDLLLEKMKQKQSGKDSTALPEELPLEEDSTQQ